MTDDTNRTTRSLLEELAALEEERERLLLDMYLNPDVPRKEVPA